MKELFGSCFAICACYCDDRYGKSLTVYICNALQYNKGILYKDTTVSYLIFRVINDGIGSSFIKCISGKLVPVEVISFKPEEKSPFRHLPAVCSYFRMLQEKVVYVFDGHQDPCIGITK